MCHKDRRDAGYRMWVYLRSGWESMIELNDIQVYCTYTSWKCGFPFHLHHFYLPFLPPVPQPDNENHSFFLFIAVFVQSIITAQINCFLLLFPLLLCSSTHFSICGWSGLEITLLQINTPEEFVVLLKSARQASESPPLCPPIHSGLYNTFLLESDLQCIPVFVKC